MLDALADAEAIAAAALRHLELVQVGASLSAEDREDLAQDAFIKLLEEGARGRPVAHPTAFVKHCAENLATNFVSRGARRFEGSVDPTTEGFQSGARTAGPETRMFANIDLAQVAAAVETLPPKLKTVYAAVVRDGLTKPQAAAELGIALATVKKRARQASEHLASAMVPADASPAQVGAYKLLNAYYSGIATARQRRAAELLLKTDPVMRVHYRGLARAHRAAGATIPPLALHSGGVGLIDRIGDGLAGARDALASAFSRSSAEAPQVAGNLAGSGVGRSAGGAGAAVVAKLGALGVGGQAAVACLAGGGAVIACVATGILPAPGLSNRGEAEATTTAREAATKAKTPPRVVEIAPASTLPSQLGHDQPAQPVAKKKADGGGGGAGSTQASEPVVDQSTAPVEQEFGVAAAATPVGGAPPDTNDSNGAAASTVRQEFAP